MTIPLEPDTKAEVRAAAIGLVSAAAARGVRPRVSFEFFPPKTEESEEALWSNIAKLAVLDPHFVSVTYGAGGSTRDRTHRTVKRIVEETPLKAAAHLTCVAATKEEVDEVLRAYWDAGVRHIVALRGDPPGGVGDRYVPHAGGYANAAELAAGARQIAPFEISVGVYPEKHPESASFDHDIDLLKRKIEAGATRGITQFFFDVDSFLRFRDRLAAAHVGIPIVPGVMPVTNVAALMRMAQACGTLIPKHLIRLLEGLDDDPATRQLVAAAIAAELCARLSIEGVEDFHFYTLNRAELTLALCRMLGVRAKTDGAP